MVARQVVDWGCSELSEGDMFIPLPFPIVSTVFPANSFGSSPLLPSALFGKRDSCWASRRGPWFTPATLAPSGYGAPCRCQMQRIVPLVGSWLTPRQPTFALVPCPSGALGTGNPRPRPGLGLVPRLRAMGTAWAWVQYHAFGPWEPPTLRPQ